MDLAKTIGIVVTAVFAIGGLVLIAPLVGVVFGALIGWIVGWFFDETILGILKQVGIEGVAMWQVGAFLGFVGGFFKSTQTNTNN